MHEHGVMDHNFHTDYLYALCGKNHKLRISYSTKTSMPKNTPSVVSSYWKARVLLRWTSFTQVNTFVWQYSLSENPQNTFIVDYFQYRSSALGSRGYFFPDLFILCRKHVEDCQYHQTDNRRVSALLQQMLSQLFYTWTNIAFLILHCSPLR